VLAALVREFESRYQRCPQAAARAPGRVNLIGEHTDYNEGLVLPCAIDRDTVALAAPAGGTRVRIHSHERGAASFDGSRVERRGDWADFAQGVVLALREAGARVSGLDLAVASRVPEGAGLSSSAALAVALTTAIDAALELGLDPVQRAHIAHRAETGTVGVACGIMDPFASALGRRGCALRIDCRSQETRTIPLPGSLGLLVADSGVTRELASSAYDERRQACRNAVDVARRAGVAAAGAVALRDLGPGDLAGLERVLDPVSFRRARHVITENERVDQTCRALEASDLPAVGEQMRDGMRSLREDFQVSTPELDALCELADGRAGVYGSRLTGAGFGGCTLHLVERDAAEEVMAALADGFERRFGRRPAIYRVSAADGAARLPL